MNLKAAVIKSNFKDQVVYVAAEISTDEEKFAELMELFFSHDNTYAQRASWVMMHCTDQYPWLIKPYLRKLVKNLYQSPGKATKRNTVRLLQFIDIPRNLWGEVIEICSFSSFPPKI